jgi:DnaJ-class molecular chaperone
MSNVIKFSFHRKNGNVECPACEGMGYDDSQEGTPCPRCDGDNEDCSRCAGEGEIFADCTVCEGSGRVHASEVEHVEV